MQIVKKSQIKGYVNVCIYEMKNFYDTYDVKFRFLILLNFEFYQLCDQEKLH